MSTKKAAEKPTVAEAKAILDDDRKSREQEMRGLMEAASQRLRCDVIGVAEIMGNVVQTSVRIIAR